MLQQNVDTLQIQSQDLDNTIISICNQGMISRFFPHPDTSSTPFDFGASWIHGMNPVSPLVPMAKSGHVEFVHTDSDVMFLRPGVSVLSVERSDHFWGVVWAIFDEAQEYAAENRNDIHEDLLFKQWLTDYLDKKQSLDPEAEDYMDEETKLAVPGLAMYWADENAIPLDQRSTHPAATKPQTRSAAPLSLTECNIPKANR